MKEITNFINDEQINKMLENLTNSEKEIVSEILTDYVKSGSLDKFNNLMLQDYEEIPVDINTFISNPEYLGNSFLKEDGTLRIYPFWIEKLNEIFQGLKNNYNECILTGGIGLGKSTIAVIGVLYVLYKLMCLRSPQEYYELIKGDKIYIIFFNITLDQSYGVAYQQMQEYLQKSPWFMKRGTISGRKNLIYTPGKNIEFAVGSKTEHGLGKAIFCLDGRTEIQLDGKTYKTLNSIENDKIKVYNIINDIIELDYKSSVKTKITDEVYKITLEDGTEIVGSDNHKLLMNTKRYKQLKNIKINDELKEINKNV